MEPVRKFKIIVNSKECGTCSGPTPSAVAKKVVKKLCGTSSKVVKFSLKECKRGCERVCGPYQGRMEKLDRPCKRDGKTITHRVVCGKVRKMRGGRDLMIEDFEKREGDGEFRIDKKIGIEPYIFFGSINYLDYDSYNYAIFCEKSFGGKVLIRDNNFLLNKLKLKDQDFINLLKQLRDYLNSFNGFRRIKSYLDQKITDGNKVITPTEKKTVVFNLSKTNNIKPTRENHQTILQNSCTKYPADYQFSGKINGNPYNTNKLFRGNNRKPRSLYLYDPGEEKYELLLTELDYLVNVDNGTSITYSGLFQRSDMVEPFQIQAGRTKIKITDIDHYLYLYENCSELNLKFPCWIIFLKTEKQKRNQRNTNYRNYMRNRVNDL